jgi:chemotaxis response regulator CheB
VTDKPHDGAAPSLPPDETLEVDSQPHESSVDHPVLHSWTESDGAGATEVMNSVDGATSIGSARTTSASDEVSAPAPANPRPKQGTRIHSARPTAGEFYVVGVGASAGGLEALESFFSPMPSDTGMAFVVVQHLSPDFRSVMDELLARWTQIPIHRVVDGMQVEPNAIYLIPPKKDMIISGGKLLLTDKEPGQGLTLPIDIFLRSLAHDAGSRAIGVILSGTGSDGSRGICEIHDAGGLVLVQDPDSAKFDGMPKSAVETGVVDAICRPIEMPRTCWPISSIPRWPSTRRFCRPAPRCYRGSTPSFSCSAKNMGSTFRTTSGRPSRGACIVACK